MDNSNLTGKDFEFLITPNDIEIKNEDFDSLMTPDSIAWEKVFKKNWYYYKVGADEFTYSMEPPGIQMTFNPEISYAKAFQIANEVAKKLTIYSGKEVVINFISNDTIYSFDV